LYVEEMSGRTKGIELALRMFKKAVQQGHSERRGEAYSVLYVEPLSEARTKLAGFFNILLEAGSYHSPKTCSTEARPQPFRKLR
jgi:hypothetical protein